MPLHGRFDGHVEPLRSGTSAAPLPPSRASPPAPRARAPALTMRVARAPRARPPRAPAASSSQGEQVCELCGEPRAHASLHGDAFPVPGQRRHGRQGVCRGHSRPPPSALPPAAAPSRWAARRAPQADPLYFASSTPTSSGSARRRGARRGRREAAPPSRPRGAAGSRPSLGVGAGDARRPPRVRAALRLRAALRTLRPVPIGARRHGAFAVRQQA